MNSKSYRLAQLFALASLVSIALPLVSQEPAKIKPEDTEIWQPVPAIVTLVPPAKGPSVTLSELTVGSGS